MKKQLIFSIPRITPQPPFLFCDDAFDCHHIFKMEKDGRVWFYLRSSTTMPPRSYVRSVDRMTPLPDWAVKSALMTEFFRIAEGALRVGSTWSWKQAKSILRTFQDSFPDEHPVSEAYLSEFESRVAAFEESKQQLKEDRMEYEAAVRRAVFPKLALPPKTTHTT